MGDSNVMKERFEGLDGLKAYAILGIALFFGGFPFWLAVVVIAVVAYWEYCHFYAIWFFGPDPGQKKTEILVHSTGEF